MPQAFIVTAADVFGVRSEAEYHERLIGEGRADRPRGWRLRAAGIEGIPDHAKRAGVAAHAVAYVNHGRWVADCPTPGCGGAILLLPAPAGFLCGTCFNAAIGGQYRVVDWPKSADRERIEVALRARPLAVNMNWTPDEPAELVEAESAIMLGGV